MEELDFCLQYFSVPGIFGIHFKDFHTLTLWVSGIRLESILKIPIYLPIVFETTNVVLHSLKNIGIVLLTEYIYLCSMAFKLSE